MAGIQSAQHQAAVGDAMAALVWNAVMNDQMEPRIAADVFHQAQRHWSETPLSGWRSPASFLEGRAPTTSGRFQLANRNLADGIRHLVGWAFAGRPTEGDGWKMLLHAAAAIKESVGVYFDTYSGQAGYDHGTGYWEYQLGVALSSEATAELLIEAARLFAQPGFSPEARDDLLWSLSPTHVHDISGVLARRGHAQEEPPVSVKFRDLPPREDFDPLDQAAVEFGTTALIYGTVQLTALQQRAWRKREIVAAEIRKRRVFGFSGGGGRPEAPTPLQRVPIMPVGIFGAGAGVFSGMLPRGF